MNASGDQVTAEKPPPPRQPAISLVKATALFAITAIAWGTVWPVIKATLAYLPPLWTTAVRSAIAVVVLFAISIFSGRLVAPRRQDVPVVLNIAILHMTCFTGLVAIGLQFVPAGRSIVLGYTTPLWVMIGASLFLAERVTLGRIVGVALGLAGLVLMFDPRGFDWGDRNAVAGNGLVLLAAFCWALSILHVRAHRWSATPFELVPWQALLATGVLTVLALLLEGVPHVRVTGELVALLLYGGIIGIAVPYWATMTVSRSLPAMTTSLGLLSVPVVGVVSAAISLGEPLTVTLLAAMALIIGGIAIGIVAPGRSSAGQS